MLLVLSTNRPWNTTYRTEDGQVIYKADAPFAFFSPKITITRVIPSRSLANPDDASRDYYANLAEVECHAFRKSRIRYHGQDISVGDFFKKSGWSWYGRDRCFTGPDGREYAWKLGARACKLVLKSDENDVIAIPHRKRLGIFKAKRPASLEIFPGGEHMVDLIVVTFIYVEKLRLDREHASHSGG